MIPLGFAIGLFGTLVGAGGGFILVPLLLFLYPAETPEHITGISLAVVFANGISGTLSYMGKGRIDWLSVRRFSLAAVPGAVVGAWATELFSRASFDVTFGVFVVAVAIYLFMRASRHTTSRADGGDEISYSQPLGLAIAFVVGFVSSLIGIGGGIIHVPAMANFLNFPVHIATATSHAVLVITSFVALVVHVVQGRMGDNLLPILFLTPGVLLGAPVGAKLSEHVKGALILRILAFALLTVGLRLIWAGAR